MRYSVIGIENNVECRNIGGQIREVYEKAEKKESYRDRGISVQLVAMSSYKGVQLAGMSKYRCVHLEDRGVQL